MNRRTFLTTVASVVAAGQATVKAKLPPPSPPKLTQGAFIAAQEAEIRELLLQMKHDLNRRFYADGSPFYCTGDDWAEDDDDDY